MRCIVGRFVILVWLVREKIARRAEKFQLAEKKKKKLRAGTKVGPDQLGSMIRIKKNTIV